MSRPGNKPKGHTIMNTIVKDRTGKGQKKIIQEAVKEAAAEPIVKVEQVQTIEKTEAQKRALAANEARRISAAAKRAEKERIAAGGEPMPEPVIDDEEEDEEVLTKKEQKFEKMLRRVFDKACGEKKLVTMTKKSDSLKMAIVKLLLDFEKKKFEMRMRAKIPQGSNAPGFFFIVRGLSDEKKVSEAAESMRFLEQVISPRDEIIDLGNDKDN